GQQLEPLLREQPGPAFVIDFACAQKRHQQHQRIDGHDDRRDTLRQPVPKSVVRTDDKPVRSDIVLGHQNAPNSLSATSAVSGRLIANTIAADLRPVSLSTPICTSISKWRTPAQK